MSTGPLLVVDDNAVNRFAFRVLAERLGYSVDLADGGVQAIAAVAKKRYAAILVDLMMPHMTGFEMASRIRRHDTKIPIIAVTALDDTSELRAACEQAGINDVITKPVDAHTVERKLRAAFGAEAPLRGSKPVARATVQPISKQILRDLYGQDNLAAILQAFFEVTTGLLVELEHAARARSEANAQRAAHELRSAATQLHVKELSDLCTAIERAQREGDWEKVAQVHSALVEAFTRVKNSLSGDDKRPSVGGP